MASLSKVVTRSLSCSTKILPIAVSLSMGIKLKSTFTEFEEYRTSAVKFQSPVPTCNPGGTIFDTTANLPVAKYGGRHTVTMMPGEGIGPEMMGYVKQVYKEAAVPVDFEMVEFNTDNPDLYSADLYNAISSVRRNGVGIKGNIETQTIRPDIKSRNVEMRNQLDLFVNVLHCTSKKGVKTRHDNIDICVIRQNTKGEYSMLEHETVPGVIESYKVTTASDTKRLVHYAFQYAEKNGRKKVTLVHKANIMKETDGLFLSTATEVAKEYPHIKFDEMIIDNCCMQLVSNPWQFDVLVTTNLQGTIASNIICGLIGGPGLTAGLNFGPKYALFEPGTRNTGTNLVGQNKANPVAMLTASVQLLEHIGLNRSAEIIGKAIDSTVNEDKVHTEDLGGNASTQEVVDSILLNVQKRMHKFSLFT